MNIKKIVRKVFVGDESSPVECEVRRRLTWRLILLSVSPLPLVFLLMYFLYCYVNMKYFTVELLQERSYKLERRICVLEQQLKSDQIPKPTKIMEGANKAKRENCSCDQYQK